MDLKELDGTHPVYCIRMSALLLENYFGLKQRAGESNRLPKEEARTRQSDVSMIVLPVLPFGLERIQPAQALLLFVGAG